MARKPNYGFDKRRKEQERQAKKASKLSEKQRRRDERSPQANPDPVPENGTPGRATPPHNEGL